MQKRVYFTGASGKAGRHVAAYLAKKGHKVLNADVTEFSQTSQTIINENYEIGTAAQFRKSLNYP
jgi:nucleoside-diphosphate-sugar epimerase